MWANNAFVNVLPTLLFCTSMTHANTSSNANTREESLDIVLHSARVLEPERLVGVLRNLKLETGDGHSLADIRALSAAEWAEMTAALVDAEVALGDR